jgi:hypothetical protein
MAIRMEQFLFKDIVRQSYEAEEACLKQYRIQSDKEKTAYKLFSSRTRKLINMMNDDMDEYQLIIFTKWCELDEQQQNKWLDESIRITKKFQDVDAFLRMFSHDR